MSINVTIDGTKYSGVDQVDVGGKSLHLESDVVAPSGSVTITENGTHDVTNYASAVVNVAGESSDDNYYNEFLAMVDGGTSDLNIVIPASVTKIREYAFYNMSKLKSISMDSVTDIEQYAFGYNSAVKITELPPNLVNIKNNAFYWATACTFTRIPASVKTIGNGAFIGIGSKTATWTFEGTPDSIGDNALSTLTGTINVPWAEGEVANAPWGATTATINYNYTGGGDSE
jgi:hypothetical protein